MSLATMNSRDRRALMLGLVILGPALAYIWGVKPLFASFNRTRDQIFEQRQLLAQEKAAVAAARQNPDLQRIADSAMRAMAPRLFEGRDDVQASAELASHLTDVAQRSDVLLQTAATRPTVLSTGIRSLRVEIRAESDIRGILEFLQTLEGSEKLLRVDRLDISRSMAATDVEGVEPLAVAATIVGFAIPDSTATGTSSAPARGGRPGPPRPQPGARR
jgi:type II secretory pathway component PulM